MTSSSATETATEVRGESPPLDWVGLKSSVIHGWFRADLGHVYPGMPIGPDDLVVDIGCGDGSTALHCARQGAYVILSDLDAPRLAAAYAQVAAEVPGRVEARHGNGEALPIEDALATRVICTEVIEHVDDPDALTAELYRITRPGGLLLISCPDPRSEEVQKIVAPPVYFAKPNHIRILSAEDFARHVTDAGFIIEHRDTYGFYWAMWWALFWSADVGFGRSHPMLDAWSETWRQVMASRDGPSIQRALDNAMPKSQIIVARRPA